MYKEILLARYFNALDDQEVTHTGLLQSCDLSGFTDFTILEACSWP